MAVVLAGAIEADEVLGVCSVGGQSEERLLQFVLLPEVSELRQRSRVTHWTKSTFVSSFPILKAVLLIFTFVVLCAVLASMAVNKSWNGGGGGDGGKKKKKRRSNNSVKSVIFCWTYFILKVRHDYEESVYSKRFQNPYFPPPSLWVQVCVLSCTTAEYSHRAEVRQGQTDSLALLQAALVARVCLGACLGMVVALFLYLLGSSARPNRSAFSCCNGGSKKKAQREEIPFQSVKYSKQPHTRVGLCTYKRSCFCYKHKLHVRIFIVPMYTFSVVKMRSFITHVYKSISKKKN